MFDGSSSEAISGESNELEVDVTLEQASTIRGLRLHYGPVPRVPVDRVELVIDDASGSHVAWTSAEDWPAVTELVVGLLETPLDGTQTIAIDPLRTVRFRLRLRGIDGQPPDVTELVILGGSLER